MQYLNSNLCQKILILALFFELSVLCHWKCGAQEVGSNFVDCTESFHAILYSRFSYCRTTRNALMSSGPRIDVFNKDYTGEIHIANLTSIRKKWLLTLFPDMCTYDGVVIQHCDKTDTKLVVPNITILAKPDGELAFYNPSVELATELCCIEYTPGACQSRSPKCTADKDVFAPWCTGGTEAVYTAALKPIALSFDCFYSGEITYYNKHKLNLQPNNSLNFFDGQYYRAEL